MDQELTRTLGELERKILELEQTLAAMTRAEHPRPAAPETEAQPAVPAATPQPVLRAGEPPLSSGRLVDEGLSWRGPEQPRSPQPPPVAPAGGPSLPPVQPPGGGASALSQPPAPAGEPPAPAPRGAPPQPQPPFSAPPAPPRLSGAPLSPRPEELLRFRERLERVARDLTDDYDELLGRLSYPAVSSAPGPSISFARGAPSLDIIDVEGLRDAAVRAFESDPGGSTAYGTAVGYPRLRSWIADRHGVEPERVLVTNGSMQADAFLFEHLVSAGDDVIVERPSYDRTLLLLRMRGARLHPIELQPDGIDVDALGGLLAERRIQPKLAHIIPNFQNPAGYTLSLEKRRALLSLAGEHGFLIFEDDPYVALRFSGEALPTMLSQDPERVVYASSFSKTVCPGIRVGYLVGPTDVIAAIDELATNTYISPSMVAQSIVYEFCASGAIERSIETVKVALAERARTLGEVLRRELPDARFVDPQGGYFMWVTLPEGVNVGALHQAAAERGVSFVKGTDFLLEGGENTLRLAYSGVTPEQIDAGITRLAEAYRSL